MRWRGVAAVGMTVGLGVAWVGRPREPEPASEGVGEQERMPAVLECMAQARLLDADGAAVKKTVVQFRSIPSDMGSDRYTDAQGLAVWDDAPCGEEILALNRSPAGFGSPRTASAEDVAFGHTIALTYDPGRRVVGTVRGEDGAPLTHAVVTAGRNKSKTSDGRYEVLVSAIGDPRISVVGPRHHSESYVVPAAGPDGVARLDITLQEARVLTVWCRDGQRRGCYGRRHLHCANAQGILQGGCRALERSDDGTERFGCECAEGAGSVVSVGASVPFSATDTEIEFKVDPTTRVRGRLLRQGQPDRGWLVLKPALDPQYTPRRTVWMLRFPVDRQGSFDFGGVPPGSWRVQGTTSNLDPGEICGSRALTIQAGQTVDLGDLESMCPHNGGIEGWVLGLEQTARTCQSVHFEPADDQTAGTHDQVDCTPAGRFSIEGLAPGRWRVWEYGDRLRSAEVQVAAGLVTEVDIHLADRLEHRP